MNERLIKEADFLEVRLKPALDDFFEHMGGLAGVLIRQHCRDEEVGISISRGVADVECSGRGEVEPVEGRANGIHRRGACSADRHGATIEIESLKDGTESVAGGQCSAVEDHISQGVVASA